MTLLSFGDTMKENNPKRNVTFEITNTHVRINKYFDGINLTLSVTHAEYTQGMNILVEHKNVNKKDIK